jgi:predicted transcriptional regulator
MAAQKVRLSLELSKDLDRKLEDLAEENSTTKSEILRKAIALIMAASSEKKKGRELGFIDSKSEKVVSRIVGL